MSNITPKFCSICCQIVNNVKRLPCKHHFCENCLRSHLVSGGFDRFGYFPCPICKFGISVPLGGLHNLSPHPLTAHKQNNFISVCKAEVQTPALTPFMPKSIIDTPSLNDPTNVTCTSDNLLVISDKKNSSIFTYDLKGKLISCFSIKEKIFSCLYTSFNSIFVSNDENHSPLVLEFSLNGKRVVSRPMMNKMESTHGICLLENPRQIVVSSVETSSLYIIGDSGKLVSKINGKGLLGFPFYIASTSSNNIVVSDNLNHSIKVIDRNGKLKTTISSVGTNDCNLYEPMGIAIDGNNILIADSGNRCVKSFKLSGKFNSVLMHSSCPEKPIAVALTPDLTHLVVLLTGGLKPRFVVRNYVDLKKHGPYFCS